MILKNIPNNKIIDHWDIIKPLLNRACNKSKQDILDLALNMVHNPLIMTSLYQDKGLVIFELTEHSIHCVTLSGEFPDNYEEDITNFMIQLAILANVPKLTLEGRKGWIRKLRHLNWKQQGNILERII